MLINAEMGIYQITIPLPFKLNHVHCYAITGDDGWWLVDTGLNYAPSHAAWEEFFRTNGIAYQDIKGIYLTHYHPDHFGAAGWLQQKSGAPVYMSAIDAAAVQRVWQHTADAMPKMRAMFVDYGMPEEMAGGVVEEMNKLSQLTQPHPQLSLVQPNSLIQLGNQVYQALLTPGHADGHLCFYNQKHAVLFAGDHVLPKITSNIGWWPEANPDPLHDYLQSLEELLDFPVDAVLPAHGQVFTQLEARIIQLTAHHAERLARIESSAKVAVTAYEVCRQTFKQELGPHELRFAMAETLSHLIYLVNQGRLQLQTRDGIKYFSA